MTATNAATACITPLFLANSPYQGDDILGDSVELDAIRKRHFRILLIDDRDDFRESMNCLLSEMYDATVTDVSSGRKAVDLLRAGETFNIIFLDLIMEDMNGVEAYKGLRSIGATCRIVVMSAHPNSTEWKELEELDVELIQKPIPEEKLTSILSEL